MRIPKHIGIIPDGNRRYAVNKNLSKEKGYEKGLMPGLMAFQHCQKLGIEEISIYGFTIDNTKRPSIQREAFTSACVKMVEIIAEQNCEILVAGNSDSKMFPHELKKYTKRQTCGSGGIKVNFLINYSWQWDLKSEGYKTKDISPIDLVIRWGGMRRLSGFLPVQSVYADFYIVDSLWPDYDNSHIDDAIMWYDKQDITKGG